MGMMGRFPLGVRSALLAVTCVWSACSGGQGDSDAGLGDAGSGLDGGGPGDGGGEGGAGQDAGVLSATIETPSGAASIQAGQSVSFSAAVSGGTAPYDFAWDFDADSVGNAPSPATVEDPGTVAFNGEGTYRVVFTVTDDAGDVAEDEVTVTVAPASGPLGVAIDSPSATATEAGESLDFGATGMGGTPPYSYAWDFDTNGAGGGPAPQNVEDPSGVTFTTAGSYLVTVTITDAVSDMATATITVTVAESTGLRASIDTPAGPQTLSEGGSVEFGASASGGTAPYAYAWDFDPDDTGGVSPATASAAQAGSVTFTAAGTYGVTLTVTDDAGAVDTATLTVTVRSSQLIAEPSGHVEVTEGDSVSFMADAGSGNLTYAWERFSPGSSFGSALGSGASTDATFNTPGAYLIAVTVTDEDTGAQDHDARVVTVRAETDPSNLQVTIDTPSGPSVAGTMGDAFDFTATVSGGTGPYTYAWSFDHFELGGAPRPMAVEDPGPLVFPMAKTFVVTVTVTDDSGDEALDARRLVLDEDSGFEPGSVFISDFERQAAGYTRYGVYSASVDGTQIVRHVVEPQTFGNDTLESSLWASPDHQWVAYVYDGDPFESSDDVLWLAPVDGSAAPVAVPNSADVANVHWSPDSRYLAYVADSTTSSTRNVYVYDRQTEAAPAVLYDDDDVASYGGPEAAYRDSIQWASDSSGVAFVANAADDGLHLAPGTILWNTVAGGDPTVVSSDGTCTTSGGTTTIDDTQARHLAVSPTTPVRIAFVEDVGNCQEDRVYLYEVGGGAAGDVSPPILVDFEGYEYAVANEPIWSPTGTHLAFTMDARVDQAPDLWVKPMGNATYRANETGAAYETLYPTNVMAFQWSPDGTYLAFQADLVEYDRIDLYAHLVGTASQESLLMQDIGSGGAGLAGSTLWSPDSGHLVQRGVEVSGEQPLFAFEIGGSGTPTTLTGAVTAGNNLVSQLIGWAPDSSRFVWTGDPNVYDAHELFSNVPAGDDLQAITALPPDGSSVDVETVRDGLRATWAADGSGIYYVINRNEGGEYWDALYRSGPEGNSQVAIGGVEAFSTTYEAFAVLH